MLHVWLCISHIIIIICCQLTFISYKFGCSGDLVLIIWPLNDYMYNMYSINAVHLNHPILFVNSHIYFIFVKKYMYGSFTGFLVGLYEVTLCTEYNIVGDVLYASCVCWCML